MDMTIEFDGQKVWEKGRLIFLDRPDIQAMMDPGQRDILNSSVLNDIGL